MVMDGTKNGLAGRLTIIASVASILVVMLGGVYTLANSVSLVNSNLDRNCRIISRLELDIRLHIFQTSALARKDPDGSSRILTPEEAEILQGVSAESC